MMSSWLGWLVTTVIVLLGVFFTSTYVNRYSTAIATGSIFALALAVPSFGPTSTIRGFAIMGSILIAVIAILRTSRDRNRNAIPANLALLLYLGYTTTIGSLGTSFGYAIRMIALGLLLLLATLLARRLNTSGLVLVPLITAIAVVVEATLGATEALLGFDAMWPRPDGSDRLENRVNHLAPWLPGRVLGSMAAPIPYGTLAAIGVIASLWMILERGRRGYAWVLAASVAAVLLSGSRSVALACILVVSVWLMIRNQSSRVLTILVGTLGGLVFLLTTDAADAFDLGGIGETNSYEHRVSVLRSTGALLTQQPLELVLFGNGDSARDLIASGLVGSAGGVLVFDNQLVRELAVSGLVGVVLLVTAVVVGWRRGDHLSRMAIALITMMFLSYDALSWQVIAILFVIVCSSRVGGELDLPTSVPAGTYLTSNQASRAKRRPDGPLKNDTAVGIY